MVKTVETSARSRVGRLALAVGVVAGLATAGVLGVVVVGGGSAGFEEAGAQETSVALSHSPPGGAVAGDELELTAEVGVECADDRACGPAEVIAHYTDRRGQAKTASATHREVGEAVALAIPGEEVGFPAIEYRLEARVTERPAAMSADACHQRGEDCETVTARSPREGTTPVAVDNVIRATYEYPDGTPAADMRVFVEPQGGGLWPAVTDDDGRMALTIPRDDPWVQQHQADERTANVFLSVFDSWPEQSVPPGEEVVVDGYWSESAAIVNFGDPDWPAEPEPQDQTLELRPGKRTFKNPADVGSSAEDAATQEDDEGSEHSEGSGEG